MCSPYLAPRDHPEDTDWEFGYRNCHGEAFIHPATGTDLAQMVTVLLPLIEKLRVDKPGRLGLPPKPCARGV
jgi:hypothetical protein